MALTYFVVSSCCVSQTQNKFRHTPTFALLVQCTTSRDGYIPLMSARATHLLRRRPASGIAPLLHRARTHRSSVAALATSSQQRQGEHELAQATAQAMRRCSVVCAAHCHHQHCRMGCLNGPPALHTASADMLVLQKHHALQAPLTAFPCHQPPPGPPTYCM